MCVYRVVVDRDGIGVEVIYFKEKNLIEKKEGRKEERKQE